MGRWRERADLPVRAGVTVLLNGGKKGKSRFACKNNPRGWQKMVSSGGYPNCRIQTLLRGFWREPTSSGS